MDRTLKSDISARYASLGEIRVETRTNLQPLAGPQGQINPKDTTPAFPQPVSKEVSLFKKDEVGFGKFMETKATLYRNGQLVVDTFTRNDNWTSGLRGKVLVVAIDAQGRAIWISKELRCATRCSVPDVSCASQGRQTFTESFPAEVGEMTHRLDIYQADTPFYVDLRASLIGGIRDTIAVITELKGLVNVLV
jgi:hypothetical protein